MSRDLVSGDDEGADARVHEPVRRLGRRGAELTGEPLDTRGVGARQRRDRVKRGHPARVDGDDPADLNGSAMEPVAGLMPS